MAPPAHAPSLVDVLVTLAVAAPASLQLVHWAREPGDGFVVRLVLSVLLVVPVLWRRRLPLTMYAFASVVALGQWWVGVTLAADVALLVLLYAVAARYRLRVALLAAAVLEVGVVLAATRWNLAEQLDLPWPWAILLLSAPVAVALLLGVSVRNRRQTLAALADRARHLELERDQQAALAVAAERGRIARELHDVVAHSISVMLTVSDAALVTAPREPERAVAALRQVSETGHQALEEMRGLLGVLRSHDDLDGRHPQPGLRRLDDLAQQVRATGLPVALSVSGPVDEVPAGPGLAVFRLVQESLTNTRKHASSPTRADVEVVVLPTEIHVDVSDDGVAVAADPDATRGLGLTGMRERVAVYGGTLSAGPGPDGGWRVSARLPYAPTAASSHRRGGTT